MCVCACVCVCVRVCACVCVCGRMVAREQQVKCAKAKQTKHSRAEPAWQVAFHEQTSKRVRVCVCIQFALIGSTLFAKNVATAPAPMLAINEVKPSTARPAPVVLRWLLPVELCDGRCGCTRSASAQRARLAHGTVHLTGVHQFKVIVFIFSSNAPVSVHHLPLR